MNLLIIGGNGQIAQLIEEQILSEDDYKNIDLTLLLRNKSRLAKYEKNNRVTLIEGDTSDTELLETVMSDVDVVYVAFADDFDKSSGNIIEAAKDADVSRIIVSSSIGLLNEEPNDDFAKWNQDILQKILPGLRASLARYEKSRLDYTVVRYGWLEDNNEIDYKITTRDEKMAGTAVSRMSVAMAILSIIKDLKLYENDVIGVSDSKTAKVKMYDVHF